MQYMTPTAYDGKSNRAQLVSFHFRICLLFYSQSKHVFCSTHWFFSVISVQKEINGWFELRPGQCPKRNLERKKDRCLMHGSCNQRKYLQSQTCVITWRRSFLAHLHVHKGKSCQTPLEGVMEGFVPRTTSHSATLGWSVQKQYLQLIAVIKNSINPLWHLCYV